MNKCSPNRLKELSKYNNKNDKSCYLNDELIKIAEAYNKTIKRKGYICNTLTNKCISNVSEINIKRKNRSKLYNEIKKRIDYLIKNEDEWLYLDFINNIHDANFQNDISKFIFKPIGPENDQEWLSNNDIDNVEEQYMDLYKNNFIFLGALPSDYYKLKKFKSSIIHNKYIGVVFNTDPHDKPGTHWVSIFIDTKLKTLDYFDSLGNLPNKNICDFIKYFDKKKYKIKFNNIVHQKAGSQCGVYACFFINERLKGKTMDQINKQIINDKMMITYRKKIFR